ncbi:ATP-binding cassette domain-containing protein [Clostridium saccharobutylicum]|uniref:ATP-binding cassette domain-containing protein n=1 Tax=Clostridium saccharobutylicum TaxID=169679 RepID=UPI00098CCB1A
MEICYTIIKSITILGDHDKDGNVEEIDLTINLGEIVCIVGPTGAGKSRIILSRFNIIARNFHL